MFSVLYRRSPEFSPPTSLAGLGRLEPQRRQLILDGLVACVSPSAPLRRPKPPARRAGKTKLHVLSSFQRTKAPPTVVPASHCCIGGTGRPGFPVHLRFCFGGALWGNLSSLRRPLSRVNPFSFRCSTKRRFDQLFSGEPREACKRSRHPRPKVPRQAHFRYYESMTGVSTLMRLGHNNSLWMALRVDHRQSSL